MEYRLYQQEVWYCLADHSILAWQHTYTGAWPRFCQQYIYIISKGNKISGLVHFYLVHRKAGSAIRSAFCVGVLSNQALLPFLTMPLVKYYKLGGNSNSPTHAWLCGPRELSPDTGSTKKELGVEVHEGGSGNRPTHFCTRVIRRRCFDVG